MNNTSDYEFEIQSAHVTGAISVVKTHLSLSILVFSPTPSANRFFIQRVNKRDKVVIFDEMDIAELEIDWLDQERKLTIGEKALYGLLLPRKKPNIFVGTREDLSDEIKKWLKVIDCKKNPTTNLSLARFSGDQDLSLQCAKYAFADKTERDGFAIAQKWFVNSIIRRRLFDLLGHPSNFRLEIEENQLLIEEEYIKQKGIGHLSRAKMSQILEFLQIAEINNIEIRKSPIVDFSKTYRRKKINRHY